MVALRATGVLMGMPTLSGQPLPVALRMTMAMALATLLYGIVPHEMVPPTSLIVLAFAAGRELLLGLAMGFVGRLIFAIVESGGRMINNEIGLGGVPGIDTPRPSQEPLASMLTLFATMLFFLCGAHLGALAAFARSFDFAPAGQAAFGASAMETMIAGTGRVIEYGFRIASPFIALNFLINLAFSVLGRAVPRTNVFVLSFSLRSLAGFGLLGSAGTLLARYMWSEFDLLPNRILQLLPPLP